MPKEKLLEALLADYPKASQVAAFFKQLIAAVQETRRDLTAKIEARLAEIRDGRDGKDGRNGVDGKDGRDGRDGKDGINGRDGIDGKNGIDGKDGSPDMAEDVRNKLELLEGEERLKLEAIRGLEEIIADIKALKARPVGGAGRALLQLYVNGAKKGAVQYLNITGAGVSYASANGRNDVTITGSGGALSVLTATGDVDDSNTTFTFASEPTLVIVNGATYRDGHGVTISTTTATLDNPVGTGGDIYGLG